MTPRDEEDLREESEVLSSRRERPEERRAPLISKPSSDTFTKVALSSMVALLAFLLGFAYNGNREMGVLAEAYRQNTLATDRRITESNQATDRRINALESATDRRLTVLENRVERIWEGGRE